MDSETGGQVGHSLSLQRSHASIAPQVHPGPKEGKKETKWSGDPEIKH